MNGNPFETVEELRILLAGEGIDLLTVIRNGKMNSALRSVLEAIKAAVEADNPVLTRDLVAVSNVMAQKLTSKNYVFRESAAQNKKILGMSLRHVLDLVFHWSWAQIHARHLSKDVTKHDFTDQYAAEHKRIDLETIKDILANGVMSNALKDAVEDIKDALDLDDISLAAELSVVKSYICGNITDESPENAFAEDSEKNESVLGNSIYGILDGVNFSLSMRANIIPSGMMILNTNGSVKSYKTPHSKQRTLQRIIEEEAKIRANYVASK